MFDTIEKIDQSTIQHGPNNNRVYLMKLAENDLPNITGKLARLASDKGYTKIFVKVPASVKENFQQEKFREEAFIPNFYKGEEGASFMASYYCTERSFLSPYKKHNIKKTVQLALSKKVSAKKIELPEGSQMRPLTKDDAGKLVDLYKQVFEVYPFPVFDEAYIKETMDEHIKYYGIFHGDKLIAASSAEIDFDGQNAEMTDFATLPEYRGKNLSCLLLQYMEQNLKDSDIKTLYTIARAVSVGMNATFGRLGYSFGGTLINNTFISEGIESMNVWYKSMSNEQ